MKRTSVGILSGLGRASALRLAMAVALAAAPGSSGVGVTYAQTESVPGLLNFQGRLTNSLDNPLSGGHDFAFAIYPAASGGSPLWSETQSAVPVYNGVLAVRLGAATPIPASAFANPDAYLEIAVDGVTLSPRERLVTAPYAFNARLLQGREAAGFVSTDTAQAIGGAKAFEGQVTLSGSTLTVTGQDAAGYSLALSSGLSAPAGTVSAARFSGDGSALTGV
ncbi:MAG: hypothetical protein HY554_10145, partial [Elusimicrobia bacterium]|nr:hypothetical protein [Elusimicrobiota bacterium]